jgi:large conductance mechanosensitive channel
VNQGIIKEFRDFILRGNVIELAVAVIIATAFTPVVTSLVEGIFTPFLAAIVGEPNFNSVGFDVGDSRVLIGLFLTAVVNFVLIAAAVFFFIVKPMNIIKERQKRGAEAPPEPSDEIKLLTEIRDLLRNQRTQ